MPLALDYSPAKETKAEQREQSVLAATEGTKSTSQLSAFGTYEETYDDNSVSLGPRRKEWNPSKTIRLPMNEKTNRMLDLQAHLLSLLTN